MYILHEGRSREFKLSPEKNGSDGAMETLVLGASVSGVVGRELLLYGMRFENFFVGPRYTCTAVPTVPERKIRPR